MYVYGKYIKKTEFVPDGRTLLSLKSLKVTLRDTYQ